MKNVMRAACGAAILSMATAASADPADQLFFTQDAGWVDPLISFDGTVGNIFQGFSGATGAGAPAGTWQTMAWSGTDEAVQSSITMSTFTDATSMVRVDETLAADVDGEWNAGDWWQITNLTQTNNGLAVTDSDVPNPLWVADTLANLRLFTDAGHTDLLGDDLNSSVVIEFWETLNSAGCAGSPSPLGTTCDDIYRVVESDFAAIMFERDGYEYTIEFALFPGPSTAGGAPAGQSLVCPNEFEPLCDGLDVPEGEIWVATPEASPGTSQINIFMSWSAEKIPAPATIGLLGAGILGMGFTGRRRKKA